MSEAEIRAREPASPDKFDKVDLIMSSYQFVVLNRGQIVVRPHGCWCVGCMTAVTEGPAALRGVGANCVRSGEAYHQWHGESCLRRAGAGVGANLQEVRGAGHKHAASLVPGTWVLVESRQCTHDVGLGLWLGLTVPMDEWGGDCKREVTDEVLGGRKYMFVGKKGAQTRYDKGNVMVAVQWLEVRGDNGTGVDYGLDFAAVDMFNSTELRHAAFEMEQKAGPRLINARARRKGQALELAQIKAEQRWWLPPEVMLVAEGACRAAS